MSRNLLVAGAIFFGSFCFAAGNAAARGRNERTGFTFGTTLRMVDTSDRTNPGPDSDKKTVSTSDSSFVSPYLGYSFGALSLGLSYSTERKTSSITEVTSTGATAVRHTSQASRGASIFTRFLFASVFFFESGVGLFQDTLNVDTENRTPQDGSAFEGKSDSYSVKGTGPGYHAAFGLELPITAGFYFTTMYQARMVTLWDYTGGSDLGRKRSQTEKREVLFGVAYYNR